MRISRVCSGIYDFNLNTYIYVVSVSCTSRPAEHSLHIRGDALEYTVTARIRMNIEMWVAHIDTDNRQTDTQTQTPPTPTRI